MKKKGFVLLMMMFLLLSVLPASAAEQRVFDNADLLTAEEEQNLQQFCEDAKEEYDIDFCIPHHEGYRRLINKGIRRTILHRTESGRWGGLQRRNFCSGYGRARRAACDLRRSQWK